MKSFITPEIFRKQTVRTFFTTKHLGAEKGDIFRAFQISSKNIFTPIQRHTNRVHILRHDMNSRVADAVITRRMNILIGVKVADCVPVLLYDPVRMVCGAVHAGWRGTADGILKHTLGLLIDDYYSKPSDIVLAIGPSIRWCCYSVGADVLDAVVSASGDGDYHMKKDGKLCLDLPSANKVQALSLGLKEEKIWMSDECTYCYPERFYSYRFSQGPTGRQGGFIGIFS